MSLVWFVWFGWSVGWFRFSDVSKIGILTGYAIFFSSFFIFPLFISISERDSSQVKSRKTHQITPKVDISTHFSSIYRQTS
jgi:hypothetical protein